MQLTNAPNLLWLNVTKLRFVDSLVLATLDRLTDGRINFPALVEVRTPLR